MDISDVVWAHGSTIQAHCSVCYASMCPKETNRALDIGIVKYCHVCSEKGLQSPVKPDVVFFGEKMPEVYKKESTTEALANVDLLLIIGTTLKVKPFGWLPYSVPEGIP